MPYRIAGIDVHKRKLAVVAADVEVEDEYRSPVPNENSVQPITDVILLNRTAKLQQFAALAESDERNSPMHACSRKHSSDTDFKAPGGGSA
jgi:hypothetical protein